MRTIPVLLFIGLTAATAHSDPTSLWGGVLVAHHVSEMTMCYIPPSGDYCEGYHQGFPIYSLGEVNARIDVTGYAPAWWFVLAAWEQEDKEWCGVEFGFADYHAQSFALSRPILRRGLSDSGTAVPRHCSSTCWRTRAAAWESTHPAMSRRGRFHGGHAAFPWARARNCWRRTA